MEPTKAREAANRDRQAAAEAAWVEIIVDVDPYPELSSGEAAAGDDGFRRQ